MIKFNILNVFVVYLKYISIIYLEATHKVFFSRRLYFKLYSTFEAIRVCILQILINKQYKAIYFLYEKIFLYYAISIYLTNTKGKFKHTIINAHINPRFWVVLRVFWVDHSFSLSVINWYRFFFLKHIENCYYYFMMVKTLCY